MTKILAGNWKMYKDRGLAREFFENLGSWKRPQDLRAIVAPSPTLLETVAPLASNLGIDVFAQNCAWAIEGAFTGETSAAQLLDLGVRGTLVGHSERRTLFGDSDATCSRRAKAALEAGLEVIYCVGESKDERQSGITNEVLKRQLAPILGELKGLANSKNFVIAYEPVWAIGTGLVATTEQIATAHAFVHSFLFGNLASAAGSKILPKILYGGSVKPDNLKSIAALPHVDGALVGGASLEAPSFKALAECLAS
jgi:triosephosphate isomerase